MNTEAILHEIDQLKAEFDRYRQNDSYRVREALAIEYTYESNRIEGNTLTLMETELVVNQGLTHRRQAFERPPRSHKPCTRARFC
jgi:Fic family protein